MKRAVDHANGELDHHDIRAFCESRDMQLWLIGNKYGVVGAVTTEIINYPRKRMLRVVTLAGKEFDNWAGQLNDLLGEWAASLQCDGIECFVRSGFTKKLAAYGFRKKYEVCYRQVI